MLNNQINKNEMLFLQCENEVPIVMACDNNFVPYLGVTIKSISEHISNENNYTVYILDNDISDLNKTKLSLIEKDNLKIKFVNIKSYLDNYDLSIFYTRAQFSIATYFRFFIPQIFKNFDKLIYCDCDAVFTDDPKKLYDTDLKSNILGAVKDIYVLYQNNTNHPESIYYKKTLKLKNPLNYFQAGMMLFNIKEAIKQDFTKNCIETLKRIKKPRFVDQDIMNIVCEDRVMFMDDVWNVANHVLTAVPNLSNGLSDDDYSKFIEAFKNPKYLHFCGDVKPWEKPNTLNADIFWKYARKTVFYEEIIYSNLKYKNEDLPDDFYSNFGQKIFSLKNYIKDDEKYKIATIIGLKIKMRKK